MCMCCLGVAALARAPAKLPPPKPLLTYACCTPLQALGLVGSARKRVLLLWQVRLQGSPLCSGAAPKGRGALRGILHGPAHRVFARDAACLLVRSCFSVAVRIACLQAVELSKFLGFPNDTQRPLLPPS